MKRGLQIATWVHPERVLNDDKYTPHQSIISPK